MREAQGGDAPPGRGWWPPPAVVIALFGADALMGLASAAGILVSILTGVPKPWFFRLGQENNLPTWYSSSQLLIVSLMLGALAVREWRGGVRAWPVAGAAAGFAILSLDEAASMHEWIGQAVQRIIETDAGLRTGIWFLVCLPPFLIAAAVLAWGLRPYLRGRPVVTRLYLLGLVLFVVSATGLEAISNIWHEENPIVLAETFLEEMGEMVGVTIMLWATLLLLRAEGVRLVLGNGRADG